MADLQGRVAELSIELAEKVVERNLDRDTQIALDRELHQPGREQLGRWPIRATAIEAYAEALLEVARAEGHLAEVEDELFRFARVVRGQRRAARSRSPTRRCRPSGGSRSSRSSRRQGARTSRTALVVVRRRRRPGGTTCPAIVDRFVELAAAEREHEVAEVRRAVAARRRPAQRLAEALSPGHRQGGRGEGRSSTRRCSAASSPASATP